MTRSSAVESTEAPKSDAAAWVKQGRQMFFQKQYKEALDLFEKALDQKPTNKDIRILAATAAYWARRPERAIDLWNRLYDTVERGRDEEWMIEQNRVMTLAALGKTEAAELAVERLYELRASTKCPAAHAAKGFVRENLFGKNMRAGCWEAFDERGDAAAIWTVLVTRPEGAPSSKTHEKQDPPDDKLIAMLAVEIAALPGGGTGFVFSEETDDASRIYKRWTQRPQYAEVRALILGVLNGSAQPIDEKIHKPAPASLVLANEDDNAVPQEIRDMRLVPQAETIVWTAWKLRKVQTDITRLARITPGDSAALDEYFRDFNAKYPGAAVTAGELSGFVAKAKAEHVQAACAKIAKLLNRSAYLEFAMLTALNTRDRDIPPEIMAAFSTSNDFLVRQTTALILARHGQKHGIEILFDELQSADARGCELISGALEELIGHILDSPPNSRSQNIETKLKDWKSAAAIWRTATIDRLEFNPTPKPGEPSWTTN